MPLNVINSAWLIVICLASEFSCNKYTSEQKLRNLAVASDYVYIGGEKNIIHLNSSLNIIEEKSISDRPVNWLLTVHNNTILIACNYKKEKQKYDSTCLNYDVGPQMDFYRNDYVGSGDLVIEDSMAKYISTYFSKDEILIIATTGCLKRTGEDQNKCGAISMVLINNRFAECPTKYFVNYKNDAKVNFKSILQNHKNPTFIYFLLNSDTKKSKLGKLCTVKNEFFTNSYEDTPIKCTHNAKVFTNAQDAVFWKDYLFVAFADDDSSVICGYKLTNIKTKFKKSRQDRLKCPSDYQNSYFTEKEQTLPGWCYNKSTSRCQFIKEDTNVSACTSEVTGDFCITTIFGSVEGHLPITEDRVVYSEDSSVNGAIVKLGVLPFYNHTVIYAGSQTGKIGKIYVDTTVSKTLERFKIVQNSFPVLDIKVLDQDVYVMTENTVIIYADKEPCPVTNLCEECMISNNPACGWDIYSKSCIENPDQTKWWLPSIGRQCLQIKVEEHQINEDTTSTNLQQLDIHFKIEPIVGLYNVYCSSGTSDVKAVQENLYDGDFTCNMKVGNGGLPLRVSLNGTVDILSKTVPLYKCSSLDSCNKCVSRGHCYWCLKTPACVMNPGACNDQTVYIKPNATQECPTVKSNKVLIHGNKNQDLKIYVENFQTYVNDTKNNNKNNNKNKKLECIIEEETKKYSVKVENGNMNYVECINVKAPEGNSVIYLEYDGSRLDGNSSLEVYNCKNYGSSCGYCKYQKFQGYECDWCGQNCKSTDSPERCNANQIKECLVTVKEVDPPSGPVFGGTLVEVKGSNVGNPNDTISVNINGVQCTNVKVVQPFQIISCITGNATGSSLNKLIVTVNGEMSSEENNKFNYIGQHLLYGFAPNTSIIAGGKKIQIFGRNIAFRGSHYEIHFCNDTDCLPCRLNKAKKFKGKNIICRIEKSTGLLTLTYLKVIIDKHTLLEKQGEFKIVGNPKLQENDAASTTVFKSGGSKITIRGIGFSNVGEVAIEGVEKLCTIKSDNSVECDTPPYVESDFNRKKRATGQNVNIHFDGYVSSYTIYYAENPKFEKLTNVVEYKDGEEGAPIMIKGKSLLEGAHQSDYTVKIGLDGTCLIQHMSNWNITCLPPKSKPRTNHSDERIVFVVVEVGNIQENLGNIRYIKALQILPIVIGVLGTALLVSVVIVVTVVLASKRKRRGAEKKFQMELLVLEDKIRETSREEFADAQMTIRDIKSDLVTSRVPYCDYQSYAFHQLFPNQDMGSHSLLFEPMVTDDNRLKVQKAMDMFDKLMTNKLFMKSLVQTLEHQNKLTMQDKAQFASLLSVCLLGNMKLFYQLISCLLIDMIKTANKKQHKVLFRRFDTITQRLMVNWLELSLYDHLKKNGGMQLFMLYKATQTVIEKAPIDAITVLCKNTLAEERLLKNRVEHEILTLDIDLNGNSDQRIPVIVLDCDTITQVKKKCCTAIYKNQPASEIPSPDELELEWHSGKSGKLTLQDIDSISDRSNGMVRLNTLKHYMVKNGSVMALMYKESTDQDDIYENQHVQGSVPTSPDHVKLLIPETTTDSQEHKWHLSNLPDEEKSNKEHEIGEIFLNRLFHTKLILRDYIEACFEGITDSQSLSIPVRYFLCMIDKQGKEVGVDGDILQSWKSECYATRVWASLIAKPQILFDVNVPSHVEPCMDILKQVFIDSFTQCPQHVTKDASTQKLLFCKDIPEYRKNVNSFFMKVEAVNDQEFWTAMDEISKEQTRKMKFSRQATLHQLYKFIDKYKDEIIEDFQEKDETKDLAFGNKLEEVIDLMEES